MPQPTDENPADEKLPSSKKFSSVSDFQEILGLDATASGADTGNAPAQVGIIRKIVLKKGTVHRLMFDEWLAQILSGATGSRRTVIIRLMNSDRARILKARRLIGSKVDN